MGMHVLYSWSLGNSWQLLPLASYILTSLEVQSRGPCRTRDLILLNLNCEPGTELTVDVREKQNTCMTFPASVFYLPQLFGMGFICLVWCIFKRLVKILQVLLWWVFFFHILFLFSHFSCLKQPAISPWKKKNSSSSWQTTPCSALPDDWLIRYWYP